MSYRDPLHAAQARIRALELKVVRLREERDAWKDAWERCTPGNPVNFPRAPTLQELNAAEETTRARPYRNRLAGLALIGVVAYLIGVVALILLLPRYAPPGAAVPIVLGVGGLTSLGAAFAMHCYTRRREAP